METTFPRDRFIRATTGALVADASDLEFAPGAPMPSTIRIASLSMRPTYSYVYLRSEHDDRGDVMYWLYADGTGGVLYVFND